jgi:hypothetical protein
MGEPLIEEFLAGESKEIRDLANNEPALVGFLTLAKEIDDQPGMEVRFYEEWRSLYQVTSSGHAIEALMGSLAQFFGEAAKSPGKNLPVTLRFDPTVKFLGGIRKDQALFLKKLKTGAFYGALWPWQRNPDRIEILLGYHSAGMSNADYNRLADLVKKFLSKKKIDTISDVGGAIHGISLPSFLQMSEMEAATYTLRVTSGARTGYLSLNEGVLIAARYEDQTGSPAAYRIISWDKATIQIEAADPDREREIHEPLMHVLMESLKIKDEAGAAPEPPSVPPASESQPPSPPEKEPQPSSPPEKESLPAQEAPVAKQPEPSADGLFPEDDDGAGSPGFMAGGPFEKVEDQSMERQGQMKRQTKLLILLGLVIVFALVVTFSGSMVKKKAIDRRYENLIKELAVTPELDAQVVLLIQYLQANPNDAHRAELENRLKETDIEIEKRDYERTLSDVSQLPLDDAYENKALSLYTAFLTKHPQSSYAASIKEAINNMDKLLGTVAFTDLATNAGADFLERHKAYRDYLERYPQSSKRETVERMIRDLAQAYFETIRQQASVCNVRKDWDACIAECDRFLSVFTDEAEVAKVRVLRTELADKKAVKNLKAEAALAGDDVAKARQLYADYLNAHPDTAQKEVLTQRIAALDAKLAKKAAWEKARAYAVDPKNAIPDRVQRLDAYIQNQPKGAYKHAAEELRARLEPELQEAIRNQRIEAKKRMDLARKQARQAKREKESQRLGRLRSQVAAKLRPVAGRFTAHADGTVTDRVTGLTWCLLDSQLVLGKCISYRDATAYVQKLNTGGHSDWRLPTAGELAAIYKNSPFFPNTGATWYWTSESFARGYHRVVDVVTSTPETVFSRKSKTEDSCGAVRAVRR